MLRARSGHRPHVHLLPHLKAPVSQTGFFDCCLVAAAAAAGDAEGRAMLRTLGGGQSTEGNIQSRPNLGLGGAGGNENTTGKKRIARVGGFL